MSINSIDLYSPVFSFIQVLAIFNSFFIFLVRFLNFASFVFENICVKYMYLSRPRFIVMYIYELCFVQYVNTFLTFLEAFRKII